MPRSLGPQQGGAVGQAGVGGRQTHRLTAARDGRVKLHQPFQTDAQSPQRHGQPRLVARHLRVNPRRAQRRQHARRPQGLRQFHDRQVQGQLQRFARRYRPAKLAVEVLRRIACEIGGPVVQQRFGQRQPVAEGQSVDQRLQRGPGRTQRLGHIDKAQPRVVGIGGGPHTCTNGPALDIGDHDRNAGLRRQAGQGAGSKVLQRGLHARVQRRAVDVHFWLCCAQAVGQMRRVHRKRLAHRRNGLALGGFGGVGRDDPQSAGAVQHAVARGAGAVGVAVGAAGGRGLRQRDQQRRLRLGQARGFAAQPCKRARPHPFKVPAHRGMMQVQGQDLVLVQHPFQRQCQPDLA